MSAAGFWGPKGFKTFSIFVNTVFLSVGNHEVAARTRVYLVPLNFKKYIFLWNINAFIIGFEESGQHRRCVKSVKLYICVYNIICLSYREIVFSIWLDKEKWNYEALAHYQSKFSNNQCYIFIYLVCSITYFLN